MSRLTSLTNELMNLQPYADDDTPLALEQYMVERARLIFLMLAGLGVQKYLTALEHEQELLMGVADVAIALYAMESALIRTRKALGRNTESDTGLMAEMTRVYCQGAFEQISTIAHTLLPALAEGDTLRTQLSVLRRLVRYTPANTIAAKRAIAAGVLTAGN